mgnify:CR=1 FL=1
MTVFRRFNQPFLVEKVSLCDLNKPPFSSGVLLLFIQKKLHVKH